MHSRDTKQTKIYNWIRSYIDENQFSVSNKLPSENTICMKLGVSRTTVRDAFACLEQEGLISRVRGSGTFINRAAVLSDGGSRLNAGLKLGLILQGQDPDANSGLIAGIKSQLIHTSIDLRIFFTDNRFSSEFSCLNAVMHQNFDGFIIDGVKASLVNPNLDCYHQIFNQKIPVIFYNNYYKELKYPKVVINDIRCAEELLSRLIRQGHRHIAGVFISDNYQSIEKFRGYAMALRKHGVRFNDDYVKWCVSSEAYEKHFVRELARFMKCVPQCTAIVCCNYMILQMVLSLLETLGKSVPADYSVVCFDYSKDDWRSSGITCSIHQGYEMGVEVIQRLLEMTKSKQHYGSNFSYVFDPKIYEGSSIAPARRSKNFKLEF